MKLQFTEFPVQIQKSEYDDSIERMCDRLLKTGVVKCIYQVGGVSDPGISDIDLYVVFRDGSKYLENPAANLPFPDSYLFSHKLFGAVETIATRVEQFTYFGNYRLVAGEKSDMTKVNFTQHDTGLIKKQIALEYLIKAWIAISIGLSSGIIKVRSFLLHAKAVQYDIDFLNIQNRELASIVQNIIGIRHLWFSQRPDEQELTKLVLDYARELSSAISEVSQKHHFYLPRYANHYISRNIQIKPSSSIQFARIGISIPASFLKAGKFFNKIQNRLNRYEVRLPVTCENIPEVIQQRFDFLSESFKQNTLSVPNFICTGHGLNIFKRS